MSLPEGLKATPTPIFGIAVEGLAYFVPNPEDQGYTEMKGAPLCAIAMSTSLATTPSDVN